MNTCKEFKDIILTDYIDGELDGKVKDQIEGHLRVCSQCREFADEVKAQLITPFQQTLRANVPEKLWRSIEESIVKENEQVHPAVNWIDRLVQSLTFPRLAPVVLSFILFISAGLWLLNSRQGSQVAGSDPGEYVADVLDSVNDLAQTDTNSFGTSIEQYFL